MSEEMSTKTIDLKPGDIVQIKPGSDKTFGACLMIVTEVRSWGAQGYFHIPGRDGLAFYRANHENMTLVGSAAWVDVAMDGFEYEEYDDD